MQERSILTDCLESLKHAAGLYQRAAFECDTDYVRNTLQAIAADRAEQQAAVFSLMHQMEAYPTQPATQEDIDRLREIYGQGLEEMTMRHAQAEGDEIARHRSQEAE